ncbi:fibronectin type III domain-containing protein [Streptomyces lasiicapitis]|uniref:fibronectin type III domain-containing protein n=1 Tax=Streptomyces lasiicapitis TaxID=1923961 RepID=UPI003663B0A3
MTAPVVTSTTPTETSVKLEWSAATGAPSDSVRYVVAGGPQPKEVEGLTATVQSLAPDTAYVFTVTAMAPGYEDEPSKPVDTRTLASAIEPVTP